MRTLRVVLSIAMVLSAAQAARGGSIWGKTGRSRRNIYADDTAGNVGDMLTIVIKERSSFDNKTNRSTSKKSSRKAGMQGSADLMDVALGQVRGNDALRFPKIDYSSSYENKFDGKAEADTERSVDDQITVAVEDVLPNGNLVVLGTRYREIAGERQTVQVSGVVRPSDIAFTNTIGSERVADFRLVLNIDGPENLQTKPGWFDWLMNLLSPF